MPSYKYEFTKAPSFTVIVLDRELTIAEQEKHEKIIGPGCITKKTTLSLKSNVDYDHLKLCLDKTKGDTT